MANILEKIIQKKEIELNRLDATNIVSKLFSNLLDREKDILTRRFGLRGTKGETLEKIGNLHNLTRERVRQIESASIKKIKKLSAAEDYIDDLTQAVTEIIDQHGGLIKRDYLLDILTVIALELQEEQASTPVLEDVKKRDYYKNHYDFILSKLLVDKLELVKNSDRFNPSFRVKGREVTLLEKLADSVVAKIESIKKPLKTPDFIKLFKESEIYDKYQSSLEDEGVNIEPIFKSKVFPDKAEIINRNKKLYALMQAIKDLGRNKFGEWGLSTWQEIKPKTVNDKIYLVLKHEARPMHFTEIAEKINEVGFDNKKANAATVHNELILDNRYVLVGRGTYAIKETVKA